MHCHSLTQNSTLCFAGITTIIFMYTGFNLINQSDHSSELLPEVLDPQFISENTL